MSFWSIVAAIYLFSLSKDETLTVNGVSSTISSTHVIFSKYQIFLPSLPISFPFISSLGRSILLVVNSSTLFTATLGNAWATIIAASLSASSFLMVLSFSIKIIMSFWYSFSTLEKSCCLASSLVNLAISEILFICSWIILSISFCLSVSFTFSCSNFSSFSSIFSSLARSLFWMTSIFSSLCVSIFWAFSSAISSDFSAFFLAASNISSSISFTFSILFLKSSAFWVSVFLYP